MAVGHRRWLIRACLAPLSRCTLHCRYCRYQDTVQLTSVRSMDLSLAKPAVAGRAGDGALCGSIKLTVQLACVCRAAACMRAACDLRWRSQADCYPGVRAGPVCRLCLFWLLLWQCC